MICFWKALVTVAVVISFECGSISANEFKTIKGLRFSEAAPELKLDLYLPVRENKDSLNSNVNEVANQRQDANKPVPCIIVIQGGGFAPQNGQRFKSFAEQLASSGFAAALISYRGRPQHQYRDTIADLKASLSYIRSVSQQHNIDPNRMGATGRSAGGTLAALLAVTGDDADSSRIQAAVCFAGVHDFVGRFTHPEQVAIQPRVKTKIQSNGQWIGAPFSKADEDWLAASPITHVDEKDPPILFLQSRDDATVPWQQSRDMYQAMINVNIPAELKIYETGGHTVNPKEADSRADMVAFFRKHLMNTLAKKSN